MSIPLAHFAVVASLTAAVPGDAPPQIPVGFAVIAAVVGGYVVSLMIHPFRKCKTCKGTGRHTGAIFSHGFRPCRSCGGSSRHLRLGARVLASLRGK